MAEDEREVVWGIRQVCPCGLCQALPLDWKSFDTNHPKEVPGAPWPPHTLDSGLYVQFCLLCLAALSLAPLRWHCRGVGAGDNCLQHR